MSKRKWTKMYITSQEYLYYDIQTYHHYHSQTLKNISIFTIIRSIILFITTTTPAIADTAVTPAPASATLWTINFIIAFLHGSLCHGPSDESWYNMTLHLAP